MGLSFGTGTSKYELIDAFGISDVSSDASVEKTSHPFCLSDSSGGVGSASFRAKLSVPPERIIGAPLTIEGVRGFISEVEESNTSGGVHDISWLSGLAPLNTNIEPGPWPMGTVGGEPHNWGDPTIVRRSPSGLYENEFGQFWLTGPENVDLVDVVSYFDSGDHLSRNIYALARVYADRAEGVCDPFVFVLRDGHVVSGFPVVGGAPRSRRTFGGWRIEVTPGNSGTGIIHVLDTDSALVRSFRADVEDDQAPDDLFMFEFGGLASAGGPFPVAPRSFARHFGALLNPELIFAVNVNDSPSGAPTVLMRFQAADGIHIATYDQYTGGSATWNTIGALTQLRANGAAPGVQAHLRAVGQELVSGLVLSSTIELREADNTYIGRRVAEVRVRSAFSKTVPVDAFEAMDVNRIVGNATTSIIMAGENTSHIDRRMNYVEDARYTGAVSTNEPFRGGSAEIGAENQDGVMLLGYRDFNNRLRPRIMLGGGFRTTLKQMVMYYMTLAMRDRPFGFFWDIEGSDGSALNPYVAYPAWSGNAWEHLKQIMGIHGILISPRGENLGGFRVWRPDTSLEKAAPLESLVTIHSPWSRKLPSADGPSSATLVNQKSRQVPRNGPLNSVWRADDERMVISVDVQEVTEVTVNTKTSIALLATDRQPTFNTEDNAWPGSARGNQVSMIDSVGRLVNGAGFYGYGGSITIKQVDSNTIDITIQGPRQNIPNRTGPYSFVSRGHGPAFNIGGWGVLVDPEEVEFGTGSENGESESGGAFNSPFVTDLDTLYESASWMAPWEGNLVPSAELTVTPREGVAASSIEPGVSVQWRNAVWRVASSKVSGSGETSISLLLRTTEEQLSDQWQLMHGGDWVNEVDEFWEGRRGFEKEYLPLEGRIDQEWYN